MKRFWTGLVAGLLISGLSVRAQRGVSVSEKIVQPQVLTDNPKVRMVRWVLEPGERSPVHTHALDHVYVVIRGSTIRDMPVGGQIKDDDQKTGYAAYVPARGKTHSFANAGQTPYEMVSIELK